MSNNDNPIKEVKKEYTEYLKRYEAAQKKADGLFFYDNESGTYRKAASSDELYRAWDECSGKLPRPVWQLLTKDDKANK